MFNAILLEALRSCRARSTSRLSISPITGAISLNGGTIELAAGDEPGRLALTATSLAALIIDPHADWTLAAGP